MQRIRSILPKSLAQHPAALVISGLLLAGIIHGMTEILALAYSHWREPALFYDSFAFVQRDGARSLWDLLTAQHNEHRIVWAKAATLMETEILKIPPGQTALFQNFLLIFGCAGLWCWLCQRLLNRLDIRLITALAGWLLLVNPWQYENLGWEFQTPWFLINALVLLGAVLLSDQSTQGSARITKLRTICALLLPWIALSSTGQGLAVAVAFVICSWLHSRSLGTLVSISTTMACMAFYLLLPYTKPSHHPELVFQLDYFLRILLGGSWQGLALLCIVITAVLLGRRRAIARQHWPSVVMPGLFALLFAGMTTLSRAGLGLEQANSSRYVSNSLMLGLSALLALALIDDQRRRHTAPLLGGFLVLLTTLGSFPQSLQSDGFSYSKAWTKAHRWTKDNRERFICHAHHATLAAQNIRLLEPCQKLGPNQKVVDFYFQGDLDVRPMGWHKNLVQLFSTDLTSKSKILYVVEHQALNSASLEIRGWAFAQINPEQQLYILADYGIPQRIALPINQSRRDVKRAHKLSRKSVGFEAALPRTFQGKPLKFLSIGTPNQSVQIWSSFRDNG